MIKVSRSASRWGILVLFQLFILNFQLSAQPSVPGDCNSQITKADVTPTLVLGGKLDFHVEATGGNGSCVLALYIGPRGGTYPDDFRFIASVSGSPGKTLSGSTTLIADQFPAGEYDLLMRYDCDADDCTPVELRKPLEIICSQIVKADLPASIISGGKLSFYVEALGGAGSCKLALYIGPRGGTYPDDFRFIASVSGSPGKTLSGSTTLIADQFPAGEYDLLMRYDCDADDCTPVELRKPLEIICSQIVKADLPASIISGGKLSFDVEALGGAGSCKLALYIGPRGGTYPDDFRFIASVSGSPGKTLSGSTTLIADQFPAGEYDLLLRYDCDADDCTPIELRKPLEILCSQIVKADLPASIISGGKLSFDVEALGGAGSCKLALYIGPRGGAYPDDFRFIASVSGSPGKTLSGSTTLIADQFPAGEYDLLVRYDCDGDDCTPIELRKPLEILCSQIVKADLPASIIPGGKLGFDVEAVGGTGSCVLALYIGPRGGTYPADFRFIASVSGSPGKTLSGSTTLIESQFPAGEYDLLVRYDCDGDDCTPIELRKPLVIGCPSITQADATACVPSGGKLAFLGEAVGGAGNCALKLFLAPRGSSNTTEFRFIASVSGGPGKIIQGATVLLDPPGDYDLLFTYDCDADACATVDVRVPITILSCTEADLTAPHFTFCPPGADLGYNPASFPDAGVATATDNCSKVTITSVLGSPVNTSGCNWQVTRTYRATDACGNTATCDQVFTYKIDHTPPVITSVTPSQPALWPPNHTMRDITLTIVSNDDCSGSNSICRVTEISSNEPVDGTGDDDTSPDWEIIDPTHIRLRAERAGNGSGRIYTITVTCTDEAGNSSTKTAQVMVAHNIVAPVSGHSFKVGSTVGFSGTFWDTPGNKHTGKWLIDGSTSTNASITEPSGNKKGKSTGSYKFNTAGVYKLQMNITDQDGVSSYANTNEDLDAIVVIYDPDGGYTYGGGWYASPAGAFTADPNATGKASYGFTINYFKNASFPKGESQFAFKSGNFEYNALNFDYLSIQGAKAQFRGTGKITGGQSGIAFIMTVTDGALDGTGIDKVRMKIFNKNSNLIYYDNQPGASDADNPVTPVGTHSTIVIGGTNGLRNELTLHSAGNIEAENRNELQLSAYPNPLRAFTVIRYVLPGKMRINLAVYNSMGQKVAQLADGTMSAGVHQSRFNAEKMANGVYMYRLQAMDETGKPVVLSGNIMVAK